MRNKGQFLTSRGWPSWEHRLQRKPAIPQGEIKFRVRVWGLPEREPLTLRSGWVFEDGSAES